MRPRLGGYHVGDIEFSAAFDIDANKVGADLSEAIGAAPNNTVRFAEVPPLGVTVQRGMTHDGLGHYLSQVITKAPGTTADITGILRETRTDVVVNFLPVGSEMATKWYVEQVLDAGCGFVNCIPVFIAREELLAAALRGARAADRGRRREVPGGRHHRAPRAHPALHGPRRAARPHQPAQRGRQHRLLQHARARSACSPRRSPRPTRCARSSPTTWPTTTSTSGRATTCRGSPTASGRTSAWRAAASATSPSTWS